MKLLKTITSEKPHTCINLKKLNFSEINAPYYISLIYFDDSDEYLDDLDEICIDIRDKGYQAKIKHHVSCLSRSDIPHLIKCKDLKNAIEQKQHPISQNQFYEMRMMGLDGSLGYQVMDHWIHDKSFIKETITITIENAQEFTHIEKKYSDGRVLEYTRNPLSYQLVTTKSLKKLPVDLDDDIRDCLERCKYLWGADKLLIDKIGDNYIHIKLTKYKEI